MASSVWKGHLTFGLVSFPVTLSTAARAETISFNQLHKKDSSRIKEVTYCKAENVPISRDEIVKGYEYEKDRYVVIEDDEIKRVAPKTAKVMEILEFVETKDIDPVYLESSYYMAPDGGGEKAYALLREAIRKTGSIGIGKIIMRQTQHLAGVKVIGDAIVLEIMRFANELVDVGEFSFPPADGVRPQEIQMAEQLIANLAEPFDPAKYTDDYRANLMRIINAKMKGKKVKLEEPEREPQDAGVVDLMSRLRESLEQGKAKKQGAVRAARKTAAAREKKPPRRKKTA